MNSATFEMITQDYDPDCHTRPDEDPAEVLRIFQGCETRDRCPLTLDDVTDYLAEMKERLTTLVEGRAVATAALFVEEFGEPLDPEETDWDGTAWGEDNQGLSAEQCDYCWPIYQAALVAETERLVKLQEAH